MSDRPLSARLVAAARDDPGEAIALLVRELPAYGACVVEWPAHAPPSMLAIAGLIQDVGQVPALVQTVGRAHSGPSGVQSCLLEGTPPFHVIALSRSPRPPLLLFVWADFASCPEYEPVLQALAQAIDSQTSRAPPPAPPDSAGRRALVFPQGYVPGDSPAIRELYREMELLLQGDLPVLIVGETGVGKESVARTLHGSSRRREGPFVAVNCAAIPAELLEAEMFGIAKGVATGVTERPGKFQLAQRGTLFLDEIGEMPRDLQSKLLRALDAREVHPVGGSPVPVDTRILCATNLDMLRSMDEGRFRRDLYYRIAGFVLRVPALHERKGHIPRLAGDFIRVFEGETGKKLRGISLRAMRALADYHWPGNVRELEHEVRRLVYLCPRGQMIDLEMLSPHILATPSRPGPAPVDAGPGADEESLSLADNIARVERQLILKALQRAADNRSEAARLLGISRNGLAIKMERLGIDGGEAPPQPR